MYLCRQALSGKHALSKKEFSNARLARAKDCTYNNSVVDDSGEAGSCIAVSMHTAMICFESPWRGDVGDARLNKTTLMTYLEKKISNDDLENTGPSARKKVRSKACIFLEKSKHFIARRLDKICLRKSILSFMWSLVGNIGTINYKCRMLGT